MLSDYGILYITVYCILRYTVYHGILYITVYCILRYTVYHGILYITVYCILRYTVYYGILYITVYCILRYTVFFTETRLSSVDTIDRIHIWEQFVITACSRVLQKLIITKLANKIPTFYEFRISLPYLQGRGPGR